MKIRTFQPDDYGNIKERKDGNGEWACLDDVQELKQSLEQKIILLRFELVMAHRLIASAAPTVEGAMQEAYGTTDPKKIGDDEEWLADFMAFNTRDIP